MFCSAAVLGQCYESRIKLRNVKLFVYGCIVCLSVLRDSMSVVSNVEKLWKPVKRGPLKIVNKS